MMKKLTILFLLFFASPVIAQVTEYETWNIPEYIQPDPNDETLKFYLNRQLNDPLDFDKWIILPSKMPTRFQSEIKKSEFLSKQMMETPIVSYLYFDDGKIVYDEKSPKERFGYIVNDTTRLLSNSVGKSLVSYVLGHAICAGYIGSIDDKMDDWPLIENTLYHNQKLIDLLNMKARDDKYVDDFKGMLSTGRWYNVHSIKSFSERELKGSKPSPSWNEKYRYNGFITNILMNYTIHKSGKNYQKLLNDIFNKKVGIEYSAFFFKNKWQRKDNGRFDESLPTLKDEEGRSWYMFYASRYDYLRIAKAILDDWHNHTCVGQYLKTLYDRKIAKNQKHNHPRLKHTSHYAGQFHTNISGMTNRKIMLMEGYGGQAIMIDFDNSRIVVVNTIHTNFDWYELVHQVIQNGHLKN
jgi:hypothetical protein